MNNSSFEAQAFDYHALEDTFKTVLPESYQCEILGRIVGERILIASPKSPDPKKKSILVVAGFHGNENAGPWGICKFLASKTRPEGLLEGSNVSFIPVVNPSAFIRTPDSTSGGKNPIRAFSVTGNPFPKRVKCLRIT